MVEGWRILLNEELHHNLYSSPNVIKIIKSGNEMGRECSTHLGTEECI
jgi:hypothetical protein